MNDWFRYFFGFGSEPEFTLFGFAHFAPIAIMLLLIFATYPVRNQLRICRHEHFLRYAMAFLLIIAEMSYYWQLAAIPASAPNASQNLPIVLCSWAAIFCSYLLIGKSQFLFDICYFWLLCACVFALITPTPLTYTGPTRFRYYQFWAEHTVGFIGIFYMIFVHKMRPTLRSAVRSYSALAVLAAIAYFANTSIGPEANYLFLARSELAPSVLDILPSVPVLRIGIMAAVIAALHGFAYLPWYLADKKRTP